MSSFTPEQLAAVNAEKKEVMLSASAGSGKTTTMIARISAILKKGADLRDFIVITFTNASAFDFREKLIGEILKIEDGERVSELLTQLETADIGTLDSFCVNIVRSYFYIAGVDPAFSVMDENDSSALKSAAAEETVEYFLKNNGEVLDRLLEVFNAHSYDALIGEANALSSYKSSRPGMKFSNPAKDAAVKELYKKSLEDAVKSIAYSAVKKIESLKIKAAEAGFLLLSDDLNILEETFDTLRSAKFDKLFEILSDFHIDAGRTRAGKNRTEEENALAAEFKELKGDLKNYAVKMSQLFGGATPEEAELRMEAADTPVKDMVDFTLAYEKSYLEKKKKAGSLDFADISAKALEILQNSRVREEISSKYKYVFVDEAQDINEMQWRIITSVSEKASLFEVGDVKQSIYMFRNAEPEIFSEKFDSLKQKEDSLQINLNKNYRSAPEILHFVNSVFEKVMTKEDALIDYSSEARLIPGGEWDARGEVSAFLIKARENSPKGRAEGAFIAQSIASLYGKKVYDFKTKSFERIRYKDIAVLTRNFGDSAKEIVKTLKESGIPATVVKSAAAYEGTYEVRCVKSYLGAIADPYDDIAFAGAMLSPFGGFSENELAEIRRNGKKGSLKKDAEYYAACGKNEKLKCKCGEFFTEFERRAFDSGCMKISEIIGSMAGDKKTVKRFLEFENGAERLANLKRFANTVAGSAADGDLGVFLATEFSDNGGDGVTYADTVKVCTVHASKGLEYKAVFLAGITGRFNTRDLKNAFVYGKLYGAAGDAYDFENRIKLRTSYKEVAKADTLRKLLQEELRLLYVALTRAKNILVLSGEVKNSRTVIKKLYSPFDFSECSSFLDFLLPCFKEDAEVAEIMETGLMTAAEEALTAAGSGYVFGILEERDDDKREIPEDENEFFSDAETERAISEVINFSYPFKTDVPFKSSVSKINGQTSAVIPEPEEKPERFRKKIRGSAMDRGTVFHKIMEKWDFSLPPEVFFSSLGADEKTLAGEDVLKRIAGLNIIKLAASNKTLKEQPFMLYTEADKIYGTPSTDKVLVQGVIDLLIETEQGLVVADYKFSAEEDDVLKERYKKQLALYAAAAENALHKKVTGQYIVNLLQGREIKID